MKLYVPDMSCGHCKKSIEEALAEIDPDATVLVDLDAKTVDIATEHDSASVIALLEAIGFPAQPNLSTP